MQAVYCRLGAHYRLHGSTGREQDVKISRIILHPSYNPVTLVHDIALLKLVEPAKLGKGIGLVCLGDDTHKLPINDVKRCYITGWGTLTSGGRQPNVLMQASVPLVSKKQCLQGYPNKIDDSMLCAGLDQGGVDACQGDSGGPLVCEYGGRWFLEGVTSWGYGCAQALRYGVYAKVRYFNKWLADMMKVISPTTGNHFKKQTVTTLSFPTSHCKFSFLIATHYLQQRRKNVLIYQRNSC